MKNSSSKPRTGIRGHLTPTRFQRLAAGIPASRIAEVARIDPGRLSKGERGLLKLTEREEAAVKRALDFCEAEAAAR